MAIQDTPQDTKTPSGAELVPLGHAPILPGEELAQYEALFASAVADFKPRDAIEKKDVDRHVRKQWEGLRYRRLKDNLIATKWVDALGTMLLDLIEPPAAGEKDVAQIKKHEAELKRYEPQLAERNVIPPGYTFTKQALEELRKAVAQKRKAALAALVDELVVGWLEDNREDKKCIFETLAKAGLTIDSVSVLALADNDGRIAHYDRMIAAADAGCNAALQDLVRYRTLWGPVLAGKQPMIIEGVKYREIAPTKA